LSNIVLQIENLSKNYGAVQALDKLNLSVKKGMVFGILGPNGSGKTTTLGILLGVLNATNGSFSWFGNSDLDENRRKIGALLETPNFYPYLSAVQNLKIVAKVKGLSDVENRIDDVLEVVNLFKRKDSNFKTYSLGMKQRLAIASALLNDPEILVLDEPTNGLDPQGIAEIRNLIIEISKEGKTIIIASHQLDEIEKVCTDVVILKEGIAIRQSKIGSLVQKTRQLVVKAQNNDKVKDLLLQFEGVEFNEEKEGGIIIDIQDEITPEIVNKYFFEKGIVLSELKEIKKSLESQFLEITGK
jgi:ABC-2 type transport system ATP-binding protein